MMTDFQNAFISRLFGVFFKQFFLQRTALNDL